VLKLSILSPERRFLEGVPVEEVTLNGSEGQIQILPGHAPMIGTLEAGEFHYRGTSGQKATGVITAGFFEVQDEHVYVLAESLELRAATDKVGHA
jgi:F-type H+-transporting ATPase subunit epsilon